MSSTMNKKEEPPDVETALEGATETLQHVVDDLSLYKGDTLESKLDTFIHAHGVVIFSKSFCPFCLDIKEFLTARMGVPVYSIEVNLHPDGTAIHKYIKSLTNHSTVPAVFIKGNFVGGCDDVKGLHTKDELEELICDLVVKKRVDQGGHLDTAKLVKIDRGTAVHPPFWFPNAVNNYVVRLTGLEIFALSIVSIIFREDEWGQWLSAGMLVDFVLRSLAGGSMSPLGMIPTVLTARIQPQLRAGPAKQFAAAIGVIFTLASTCCYFTDHLTAGAIILGLLACAAALEGFGGICIACEFFMFGIQYGFIPDSVYRIYTSSRQELKDSWAYKFGTSGAAKPEEVDTDPSSKIALKYKKKTDDWTKDDFHLIRNMLPCYFAIPLSISGLATAFKIASSWSDPFRTRQDESTMVVPDAWYQTFAVVAAVFYVIFFVLYTIRLVSYPKKCKSEWSCPQRSPSFGAITITMMLFAFLLYDEIDFDAENEQTPQKIARVALWIGTLAHSLLTIAKMAEWIGTRMEFEHVQPQWLIMPVGLAVAALVGSVVPFFEVGTELDIEANVLLGQFFLSFGHFMWIALFAITFFKVVTGHNSDPRKRHGIWVWLASSCVVGMADFAVCSNEARLGHVDSATCSSNFGPYYFIGIFFFLSFVWATFPYIGFLGRDPFNKGYWMDCFCIDTLAACAALFYALNNFNASRTLMFIGLTIAALGNMVALLHTITALIRRRTFFTPMDKWGPLSFFKLTHEGFRGAIPKLTKALAAIDLDKPQSQHQLELFAANYSSFLTVHVEHAQHEDTVIFKTFNDFFPGHGKEYTDDHEEDRAHMDEMHARINQVLDSSTDKSERQSILSQLQQEMPVFFEEFLTHIRGEEDNMQPIGRKYMPLELQKQMARECFRLTPADKWEIFIPFVISSLPRHMQRVRFLKSLCWSLPERAQQIGAILYRNVDAVMWERLRIEIPEIIPRGEHFYRRYQ